MRIVDFLTKLNIMKKQLIKKKVSKKKPSFVFIVDSYEDGTLRRGLEDMGLNHENDYHITGAGGADWIMANYEGRRIADTLNLLVVMSTFHGSVAPAVELCKQVKAVNSKARFIFRSQTSSPSDPLFEACMDKSFEDNKKLLAIIKKFFGKK